MCFEKRFSSPKRQILEFADDNFKFDENGGMLSKQVENAVGKGEIARYEQFLLFQQCFQKTCTANTWKQGFLLQKVLNESADPDIACTECKS